MEDYLLNIGKRIKEIRKDKQLIISDVADKAGVSNGLISRIENGRSFPSLPVLLNIIGALNIEVSSFFDGMEKSASKKYIVTRKNETYEINKEVEAEGFIYNFIFNKSLQSMAFEVVLLEILPGNKRQQITTDAYEFKYILTGELYYHLDDEQVKLSEGDSIFFDGRVPHVPLNKSNKPAKMLVLYFFN
ncbi:MAG: helix-turn-helix transcriptional regulator [Flavobacteriaceae bacterium]|nr:helix-turn-helix transcriptional regulator [Flavobacteriaceae bacterium]